MNIYIPSLEEARQYRFVPESYEWPDDVENISQKKLLQPMFEARDLYWEEWHKNNTKKEQIYIKKGFSEQEREERSKRAAQRNNTILECPHCNKTGNVGNMKRWHFNNCGKARRFNKDAKGRFA